MCWNGVRRRWYLWFSCKEIFKCGSTPKLGRVLATNDRGWMEWKSYWIGYGLLCCSLENIEINAWTSTMSRSLHIINNKNELFKCDEGRVRGRCVALGLQLCEEGEMKRFYQMRVDFLFEHIIFVRRKFSVKWSCFARDGFNAVVAVVCCYYVSWMSFGDVLNK